LGNSLPFFAGGYFVRWVEKGTGVTYSDKWTEITMNRNATYIAVFEVIYLNEYVYTYAEGSHGTLLNDLSGIYRYDDQINLNNAQPTAVTLGHEFKYWEEYIASSDSWIPVALTGGQSIVTVGEVNDYRAIFGIEDYSITYHLDGGTDPGNPTTYNIDTQTFTLTNLTKTGYTFAGWTGTGLTGPTMTVEIAQGSTGDREYTATWTAKPYTVEFEENGGSAVSDITQDYDTQIMTEPATTKDGHTFGGWYTDAACTDGNEVTFPYTIKGAATLYAKWTIESYALTYDLDGGTDPGNPATYNINTPTFQLQDPTKDGYTFDGWTWSGQSIPTKDVEIPQGSNKEGIKKRSHPA